MTDRDRAIILRHLAFFATAILLVISGWVIRLDTTPSRPGAPTPGASATAYTLSPAAAQGWPKWQCHFKGNPGCYSPPCSWAHGTDQYHRVLQDICRANISSGSHWRRIGAYDGHRGCFILVGGTSLYKCGKWLETS